MRNFRYLPATLALLSLSASCTSTQVKEASGTVAGGLFRMGLDVATNGPEQRREAVPGEEWNRCPPSCELAAEMALRSRIEDTRRRERRDESEAFGAEFKNYMRELEEPEAASGSPPSIVMTEK
jgi:hypothetical protein